MYHIHEIIFSRIIKGISLTLFLMFFLAIQDASAQVVDNSRRVDTLSLAERISVRTNLVDWVLTVPNVGVEFDLGKYNWNRYAINANIRWRPRTSGTYVHSTIFNLFEATIEGRMYWRERRAEPTGYLKRHDHWWDKLMSCRNMSPSHPKWVFYRGVYASYSDYAFLFGANEGRQGQAFQAGITWGFVKPFVFFQSGNSIDMEFGASVGACITKYDRFRKNAEDNCLEKTGAEGWQMVRYPMVRELHAALVYRFGNYNMLKKYRWRYDVDMPFREKTDSIWHARWLAREQKFIKDSIYNVVAFDFKQLYDSCVDVRRREAQQAIDAKSPKIIAREQRLARKRHIEDSIAARKDSLEKVKAIYANKRYEANRHQKALQEKRRAEEAAEKAKVRAAANEEKLREARNKEEAEAQAKALRQKLKASKQAQENARKKASSSAASAAKAKSSVGKTAGKTAVVAGGVTADATKSDDADEPVMSAKERKKLEQQEKAARAKAAAERMKERLAAQKAARKNSK